jgi:glycosyltransferase involved in cell wall biosynthesis
MLPKISIITPCFNGAATIEACIQSIHIQDYPNVEHIVVDGGSTDGTLAILDRLNVHYISEVDAGIYDAMNKGISLANGEIIGILNCDDFYSTDHVISLVAETFQKTGCELCHGNIHQVDAMGQVIWRVGSDLNFAHLLKSMKVAHPSVFVSNLVYRRFGSFSVGFKIAADYEFLLRIWEKVDVVYLDVVMVMMRMDGISNQNIRSSYIESYAAALLHGRSVLPGFLDYIFGIIKGNTVRMLRKFGVRKYSTAQNPISKK